MSVYLEKRAEDAGSSAPAAPAAHVSPRWAFKQWMCSGLVRIKTGFLPVWKLLLSLQTQPPGSLSNRSKLVCTCSGPLEACFRVKSNVGRINRILQHYHAVKLLQLLGKALFCTTASTISFINFTVRNTDSSTHDAPGATLLFSPTFKPIRIWPLFIDSHLIYSAIHLLVFKMVGWIYWCRETAMKLLTLWFQTWAWSQSSNVPKKKHQPWSQSVSECTPEFFSFLELKTFL